MWADAILAFLASAIAAIPFLQGESEESLKDDFLVTHSGFYVLTAFYFGVQLFGFDLELLVGEIIMMGAIMFLTSFVSFYFDKKLFFYVLVSVPLSLFFPTYFGGRFIGAIGAIMACIVMAEVFIYLTINGNLLTRTISIFGIVASFTGIVAFFPLSMPLFDYSYKTALIISYLCIWCVVWLLGINDRRNLSLITESPVTYIWYMAVTLLFIMTTGTAIDFFSPAYTLSGIITILILSAIHLTDMNEYAEVIRFVTSSFLASATIWLIVSLISVSQLSPSILIVFDVSLVEVLVLGATHLLSIVILGRAEQSDVSNS